MIVCKRGSVILVPFPFTDFSTFKQRPALVVSSDGFNAAGQDVVAAAITSHIPHRISETDFVLSDVDLKAGGLPKASIVKIGKIITIDQRLIRKKLGSLPTVTIDAIISKLHAFV